MASRLYWPRARNDAMVARRGRRHARNGLAVADQRILPILIAVAYDEELADRIRAAVEGEAGLTEKRMFGGLAFLIDGNMAVSASSHGGLLLRVDPDSAEELVKDPAAERFEMRGREMNGWLRIDRAGVETEPDLERWVAIGIAFARSLPPKKPATTR